MKTKPQIQPPGASSPPSAASPAFDVDRFIGDAMATKADRLPRTKSTQRRITGRGRMPGPGIIRTSLDLPDELYEKLKLSALKRRRTLRETIIEGMVAWLEKDAN